MSIVATPLALTTRIQRGYCSARCRRVATCQAMAWFVMLCLVGCGSAAIDKVPVSGVIRLESGPWPAEGNISFVPLETEAGRPRRPGWATFDREGRFEAGCVEDGDGLAPGTYLVNVDCWDVPAGSVARSAKSCIPVKYRRGFQKVTVPATGEPVVLDWKIPAR